jgi:hypothetical protein
VEVAETAGKIEVVIDATALHLVPRCHNPLQFQRVLRLVVVGKLNEGAQSAQRSPRVAGIGHIEGLTDHQADIGGASHRIRYFAVLERLQSVFYGDILEDLLSMLRAEDIIQVTKRLL